MATKRPYLTIIWLIYVLAYLSFVLLFTSYGHGPLSVAGLHHFFLSEVVNVVFWLKLLLCTLLVAIPTYLALLARYEQTLPKAPAKDEGEPIVPEGVSDKQEAVTNIDDVHENADEVVLEEDIGAYHRMSIDHKVLLWMLFALLFTVMFAWIIIIPTLSYTPATPANTREADEQQAMTGTATTSDTSVGDISLLPKYGGYQKTPEMLEADRQFLEGVMHAASSADEALAATLLRGWSSLYSGKLDTAIRRFNQAWLISATSSQAPWGMADVESLRENYDTAEQLFREARAYDDTDPVLFCDIGAFYLARAQATPSMASGTQQTLLHNANEAFTKADALGHHDAPCFTHWATVAYLLGDNEATERYTHRAEVATTATSTESTSTVPTTE